ncbi:MAG: class I SAM-dependent methyltransferase [Syntrophales bacterium]|nr:class I SAM-dependent methyltransferase [Syntrophales bacterium]MDD5641420.1 class I SAM-dependent methyltransferase [Syntrophales bacterium]
MPEKEGLPLEREVEQVEEVEAYFRQWQSYSKVVAHNYLHHREVYALLRQFLLHRLPHPFMLLDLGCGDAAFIAQALAGTAISRYLGVDLARRALDLAAKNLAGLRCEHQLQERDYFAVVHEGSITADVIWLGLTFHHLPRPQKAKFLQAARQILPAGGYLLMYEPTLLEDEDRDGFLERSGQIRQNSWPALTAAELESIGDHINNHDFPEKVSTLEELAREQGFSRLTAMFQDPDKVYTLMCLEA